MPKALPEVEVVIDQEEGGLALLIRGQPVPASRPRVGRWGTYYSATYKNWMQAVGDAIDALSFVNEKAEEGKFRVCIHCVFKRPVKLTKPLPRPDIDNVMKAPLDMVTKKQLLWADDTQVAMVTAVKRYAEVGEEPHMVLTAERID